MRLHGVWISLVVIWSILQTGCGGTQRQQPLAQAESTFFETHDVFYLSPSLGAWPYQRTKIFGYQVEKSSGAAVPVPGSPYTVADGSAGQSVSVGPIGPARRFLLAARDLGFRNGNEVELFTISAKDGSLALSSTASVPSRVMGLTFDSTGRFVYASVNSSNGNSIFSFRIEDATLMPIDVTPVPFQADFPTAIANPRKPLLLVYGVTEDDIGNLNSIVTQHFTTFRIDRRTGTLTPTGHTYVGTDLPFYIAGMDAPGNFLFGADIYNLREFALHDDGSIEEMTGNALPFRSLDSAVDRVVGNPATNVLYMHTTSTFHECALVLASYDSQTGAMSISRPSDCDTDPRLAEVTSDFLFGTYAYFTETEERAVVLIYRLDRNGNIVNESYVPVP